MDSLDSSSDASSKDSWIERFLSLDGNEFMCDVDEDYIKDNFNLYGLRETVSDFKHALKIILDRYDSTASDSDDPDFISARELYGLIHQRFILTRRGLDKMFRKYRQGDFGRCPVVNCNDAKLLPIGRSDLPHQSNVKLFCPACHEIFHIDRHHAAANKLDGAYFGTTFPHLLIMQFKEQFAHLRRGTYVPRIFGFKVHRPSTPDSSSGASGSAGASSSSSSSVAAHATSQSMTGRSKRKARPNGEGDTSSSRTSAREHNLLKTYETEVKELREANLLREAEINSLRLELEKSRRKKEKVENALGKVVTDMLVETPVIADPSSSKRKKRSSAASSSSGKRQRKHERRSR
jgi:casein kinase II subunit beta